MRAHAHLRPSLTHTHAHTRARTRLPALSGFPPPAGAGADGAVPHDGLVLRPGHDHQPRYAHAAPQVFGDVDHVLGLAGAATSAVGSRRDRARRVRSAPGAQWERVSVASGAHRERIRSASAWRQERVRSAPGRSLTVSLCRRPRDETAVAPRPAAAGARRCAAAPHVM